MGDKTYPWTDLPPLTLSYTCPVSGRTEKETKRAAERDRVTHGRKEIDECIANHAMRDMTKEKKNSAGSEERDVVTCLALRDQEVRLTRTKSRSTPPPFTSAVISRSVPWRWPVLG